MSIKDCPRVPITDVLSFVVDNRGKTVPTAETGTPLIATNCILNERLYPVFDNIRYVSDDILQCWFRAHLKPHDILFVNKGTPGRCCLVPNPVTFCAAQDMIGLRCDAQKIYYRYLLMALRSAEVQKTISNNHVGLVIPHFKKENLSQLMIPVPEMEEQKALGDLYFQLCEKIENNIAICSTLEAVAKLLYDYWFVQFDFPDENGNPYKSSGGKMVWNEALGREIPEGWKVGSLYDISRVVWGQCPDGKYILGNNNQEGDLLDYCSGAGDMRNGFVVDCQAKTYASTSRRIAHRNAVLMSVAGSIGAICVTDHDISLGRAAVAFEASSFDCNMFIFNVLLMLANQVQKLATGSIQKVINSDHVESMRFAYDEDILFKYGQRTRDIYNYLLLVSVENKQLASLREFLLPMLMNGQVTVDKSGD